MSTYGGTAITGTAGTILAAASLPSTAEENRRKGVTLLNDPSNSGTVFVGVGAGTALAPLTARGTALSGFPIVPGAALTLDQQSWDVIQGIAGSGTVTVSWVAESGVGE